jgi:hypothetical protein
VLEYGDLPPPSQKMLISNNYSLDESLTSFS